MTIGVGRRFQRQGIAASLMEALIARAREQGAKRMLLEVRVDNTPAYVISNLCLSINLRYAMIICVSVSSKETINSTFYASYEHTFLTEVLKLKKKELTFIIGIVVFALLLWGGMYLTRRGNYGSIRITVNGEEYGTYSLGKDQVIKINGTNVCEIKNGEVKMTEADCPDHLCMKQKAVDSTGGTIVCLPNKVVIEGEKGESLNEDSPEFDTAV